MKRLGALLLAALLAAPAHGDTLAEILEAILDGRVENPEELLRAQLNVSEAGGSLDASGTPSAGQYARFSDANTLVGRTASESRTDLDVPSTTDLSNGLAGKADTGHNHDATYQPLATDLTRLVANCDLEDDATPIPDSCVGDGTDDGGGSGAPTDADYLVGTANGSLSAEIVVGTSPGGELGGTWGSPTLDDGVTVDTWALGASTATTASANDSDTSLATTAFVQGEIDDVDLLSDNCVLENDATPIPDSCVGNGSDADTDTTNFNADGDNNSPQTINATDELLIAGGTNGIDTVASATDTVTINLDLSESSAGGELGGTLDAPTVDDGITLNSVILGNPTISAGSASAGSWPKLTAGTVLTTAEDGAIEQDANTTYLTTDAGNRGYVPTRHIIRANATRTLPNDTNENAIFDSPANGRLTLETGTYIFNALIGVTAMSATSGNALIDIKGAGTATINDWLWGAVGKDGTMIGVAAVQGTMPVIQDTPASMFTAGTGTELWAVIDGTFTVTSAGTIIPSIDLVTASAAVVAIGSYFMCERIGDASLVAIGQWD